MAKKVLVQLSLVSTSSNTVLSIDRTSLKVVTVLTLNGMY